MSFGKTANDITHILSYLLTYGLILGSGYAQGAYPEATWGVYMLAIAILLSVSRIKQT